jgi:hypothetical protein
MTPNPSQRPAALPGHTLALTTHCGKIFITVNRDPSTGMPVEVFCRFGKAGGCGSAIMDGMTRMISYGLRAGMPAEHVILGLKGISCYHGPATCMDALARAISIIMESAESSIDPNELLKDEPLAD